MKLKSWIQEVLWYWTESEVIVRGRDIKMQAHASHWYVNRSNDAKGGPKYSGGVHVRWRKMQFWTDLILIMEFVLQTFDICLAPETPIFILLPQPFLKILNLSAGLFDFSL